MHVFWVWSMVNYHRCESFILDEIKENPADLYLLTAPDIAWEYDVLREYPEPDMRAYFFALYHEIVINTKVPYTIVRGNKTERLIHSINIIKALLGIKPALKSL
jgi:Predicted ATPase/kinase involved in NAD metabolism